MDTISKLVGQILSLNSALESLKDMGTISERQFGSGFKSLMGSISNFASALTNNVDGLIRSLQSLRIVWMDNESVLFPLIRDFSIITDNLWGVAHNANRMAEEFRDLWKNSIVLEKGFDTLIGFIKKVVDSTEEFYTPAAAAELSRFIFDVGVVIAAFEKLEGNLKGTMDKIERAIDTAVSNIEGRISSLDNLVRDAVYWGQNMMIGFISGIYSMEDALALAAQRMAAIVAYYLGASSNTKLGPLAHLEEWGPNLVKTYVAGINRELPALNATLEGLGSPMSGAAGAMGGTRSVTLYNTQYISDKSTADYANQELGRLLQRHEVM